ncbi:MAG: ribonuclease catalytic domain-containing protein [Dissulfuribacterales bacterium]
MEIANGQVIEFLDEQRFICAVVLDKKGSRYHVLTHLGRELTLSDARFLHVSSQKLPFGDRDTALHGLQGIHARRNVLLDEIDIPSLWELIKGEQEAWSCTNLAQLVFTGDIGPDHEAALIRSVILNHTHFKFKNGQIVVQPVHVVELLLAHQERERQEQEELARSVAFLKAVWSEKEQDRRLALQQVEAGEFDGLLLNIADFCIKAEDSSSAFKIRTLFKQAGLLQPSAPFDTMVKAGRWSENENLELARQGIERGFSTKTMQQAAKIAAEPFERAGMMDMTGLSIFTIDSSETLDIDDALSFRPVPGGYELGVHITGVGGRIPVRTPLFDEAIRRATSIYLPDETIPMLPEIISSRAMSLIAGEERPAISFLATLDEQANILKTRIVLSVIRVAHRFTYDGVDTAIRNGDEFFVTLLGLCETLQQRRIEAGAMPLPIPDVNIRIVNGEPEISLQPIGPARFLVSECMVLANRMAAEFLRDNHIPAIYRSQPPPKSKLISGITTDIKLNYRQRRCISRGVISQEPEFHTGLGLEAYTTVTSPLRRGLDLLMQQQIASFLNSGLPIHTSADLESLAIYLNEGLISASIVSSSRQRYWLLRHLEKQIHKPLRAWVLDELPQKTLVVLHDYLMPVEMPKPIGMAVTLDEDVTVYVNKVSAREGVLMASWNA